MITGMLAGLVLGLAGLVPGLHFAMVLLSAGPWLIHNLGLAEGILAMVTSVGVARSMHTLTVVYHPVAADQIASADPAQRLRARGQGQYATQIMSDSLWVGVTAVVAVVGVSLIMGIGTTNPLKGYLKAFSLLIIPAIPAWIGFTIYKAKNKWETLVVFTACGILGILALDHPSVRGSSQSMTPLLAGVFGLPILLASILQGSKHPNTKKLEPIRVNHDTTQLLNWIGMLVGFLSVTLPGLSNSSLVSTLQDHAQDDAQYLRVASVAESVGELFALLLGILALASRSSDAAVISQVVRTTVGDYALGPQFPWIIMITLVGAVWIGLKLTSLLGIPYRVLMNLVPQNIQSLIVALGVVWVVWSHTGSWGLCVMFAGTMIHFGARKLGTPNQAFFACIVVPMCVSMLGINIWP